MTFLELYNLYWSKYAQIKLKAPENIHYWAKAHLATWATQDLGAITKGHIQDWVDDLGAKSQSAATRAVNQLSAIFSWGIRRGYFAGPNPCLGVEKFEVRSRDRFLLPDELNRFKRALDSQPRDRQDLFWMFLYTGARRENILSMRWDEVDFSLAIWRIPGQKFKNGDSHLVPLTPEALAVLERRRRDVSSPWVFPGRQKGTHLKEPKRAWQKVLKQAGLSDLRLHDLRRTVGSYMAIQGASQYVIGKTLGHRDQRSTAIYARLNLDPVRQALGSINSTYFQH